MAVTVKDCNNNTNTYESGQVTKVSVDGHLYVFDSESGDGRVVAVHAASQWRWVSIDAQK